MDLSIIITYYSGYNVIVKCLEELQKALNETDISTETIIVNDNPDENLEQLLQCFSGIKIINHEKNQGHPAACNTGAKNAIGNLLLFMDCDIFVTVGWLNNLLNTYYTQEKVGAVSSMILDAASGRIHSAGIEIHKVDFLKVMRGNHLSLISDDCIESNFLSSACLLIPKEIFVFIKGYDEVFFNSDGDLDITHRIREAGYRLLTACKSVVYHKGRVAGTMRNLSVNDTKALLFRKWGYSLPDGLIAIQKRFCEFKQKNQLSKEYVVINVNKTLFLEDYISCIKESLGISVVQILNFKQYSSTDKVSLIDFLSTNIVNYNTPLLFFSENYRNIVPNYFWFLERCEKLDISADYNGNIDYINNIL